MLVIVFLGLLAVALSHGADNTPPICKVDINKDGIIRLSDMIGGFNNDDLNNDGLLTLEEFAAGAHPGSPPLVMEKAFNFLDRRDKNIDGILDPSCSVSLFDSLDANKDGKMTREECNENYILLYGDNEDGDK